jgi:phage tail protein X
MAFKYTTKAGDTVDYIAWRHYGRQDGRIVERLLDANPGLSDVGPDLPAGRFIVLPEFKVTVQQAGVRLWD